MSWAAVRESEEPSRMISPRVTGSRPGDGSKERALARAVGAQHGDHFPFLQGQGHPLQSFQRAVVDVQVSHLEKGGHSQDSTPRYASMTRGLW